MHDFILSVLTEDGRGYQIQCESLLNKVLIRIFITFEITESNLFFFKDANVSLYIRSHFITQDISGAFFSRPIVFIWVKSTFV